MMQNWSISNLLNGPSLALFGLLTLLILAYFGLAVSFRGAVQVS